MSNLDEKKIRGGAAAAPAQMDRLILRIAPRIKNEKMKVAHFRGFSDSKIVAQIVLYDPLIYIE